MAPRRAHRDSICNPPLVSKLSRVSWKLVLEEACATWPDVGSDIKFIESACKVVSAQNNRCQSHSGCQYVRCGAVRLRIVSAMDD
eukprot:4280017-Amphidinium_carterae.1